MFGRLGLAVARPRAALAIAGERGHAGRSGQDLLALICMLVVATQLRGVIAAVWLGHAVSWMLGLRAFVQLLQGTLTLDLSVLVVIAAVIFAVGGRRREVGRAFDLACVCIVPLVLLQLIVMVGGHAFELELSPPMVYGPALAWTGMLVALAALEARAPIAAAAPPRWAIAVGYGIAVIVSLGGWQQLSYTWNHVEYVRPLTQGLHAPPLELHEIGPNGAPGKLVSLADTKGKIVIVDFWATWCQPCLHALPELDVVARAHPDIVVIAVNLEVASEARALFDDRKYAMTLVADDGDVSARYGVGAIPHTVVIDQHGIVRTVSRGSGLDLEAEIAKLHHEVQ